MQGIPSVNAWLFGISAYKELQRNCGRRRWNISNSFFQKVIEVEHNLSISEEGRNWRKNIGLPINGQFEANFAVKE